MPPIASDLPATGSIASQAKTIVEKCKRFGKPNVFDLPPSVRQEMASSFAQAVRMEPLRTFADDFGAWVAQHNGAPNLLECLVIINACLKDEESLYVGTLLDILFKKMQYDESNELAREKLSMPQALWLESLATSVLKVRSLSTHVRGRMTRAAQRAGESLG